MAAPMAGEFDAWLGKKLQSLNPDTDLDVFVEYIRGILETETSTEDRDESLIGILAGITEDELEEICQEIVQKWTDTEGKADDKNVTNEWNNMDRVAAIMVEQQKKNIVPIRELSAEEKARKAAILAQYSQVSDGEASDEEEPVAGGGGGGGGAKASAGDGIDDFLAENVNARLVVDREKDERDKNKKEAGEKKQKDKADREKQKQKAEDRKDSEKKRTTKGERRR